MFVFNFTLGYQIWTNCLQNISNYLRSCCRTLNIILLPGPTHNVTIIKISFRKEKKSFFSQRPLNTWGLNFSSTERITKKNLSLEIKKMYFWKVFFFSFGKFNLLLTSLGPCFGGRILVNYLHNVVANDLLSFIHV